MVSLGLIGESLVELFFVAVSLWGSCEITHATCLAPVRVLCLAEPNKTNKHATCVIVDIHLITFSIDISTWMFVNYIIEIVLNSVV